MSDPASSWLGSPKEGSSEGNKLPPYLFEVPIRALSRQVDLTKLKRKLKTLKIQKEKEGFER